MNFELPELSPPQQGALDLMLDKGRALVSLRMGMGKTLVTILANKAQGSRKWLIICPKNAQLTWRKEIEKWASELSLNVYSIRGAKPLRTQTWINLRTESDWIASCTYAGFMADYLNIAKLHPDVIICDESHRIRNRKSKGFKLLRTLKSKHMYLLTGTPVTRGPQDFWTSLHLVNRKEFSGFWKYAERYHDVQQGYWGVEIGEPQNMAEHREIIKPYVYSISREEANKYLPPLTRQFLPIEMSKEQRQIYKALTDEQIALIGNDKLLVTPNKLSQYVRFRQLLICPQIFDSSMGHGPAIEMVAERILDCPLEDRHCVIFTPFTAAIEHFQRYLYRQGLQSIEYLQGGLEEQDIELAIDEFRANRGIMICSTHYSESFELDPATICYSIGPVWDPNVHDQAEGRLRRMTGHHPIMSYYAHFENTLEDHMMDVLSGKVVNIKLSMPVHEFLRGAADD